jgi:hypothetical protein
VIERHQAVSPSCLRQAGAFEDICRARVGGLTSRASGHRVLGMRLKRFVVARLRRASRATLLGAVVAVLVMVASALAASKVYVSVNAGGSDLRVRPARIHLLSNENLRRLTWRSWGGSSAAARGIDHGNGPSPGHKATNPVHVKATDRRQCGNKLVYTTIRLYFPKGVPYAGQPHHTKYAYGCPR